MAFTFFYNVINMVFSIGTFETIGDNNNNFIYK